MNSDAKTFKDRVGGPKVNHKRKFLFISLAALAIIIVVVRVFCCKSAEENQNELPPNTNIQVNIRREETDLVNEEASVRPIVNTSADTVQEEELEFKAEMSPEMKNMLQEVETKSLKCRNIIVSEYVLKCKEKNAEVKKHEREIQRFMGIIRDLNQKISGMENELQTLTTRFESLVEVSEKMKVSMQKSKLISGINELKQSKKSSEADLTLQRMEIKKKQDDLNLLFRGQCSKVLSLVKKLSSAFKEFELANKIYKERLEEAENSFSTAKQNYKCSVATGDTVVASNWLKSQAMDVLIIFTEFPLKTFKKKISEAKQSFDEGIKEFENLNLSIK